MYETADGRQDSDYDYPYAYFKKPFSAAKRRQNNKSSGTNSNFPNAGTVTLLNVTPYESDYENADDIHEYMEMIDWLIDWLID